MTTGGRERRFAWHGLAVSQHLLCAGGDVSQDNTLALSLIRTAKDHRLEECPVRSVPSMDGSTEAGEPWNIDREQVIRAAEILTSVDALYERQLEEGRLIRVRVGLAEGPPTTLTTPRSLGDYRDSRFAAVDLIRPIFLPRPVLTQLLPFQAEGVNWLVEHRRAILADDMGLGKTVQTIFGVRWLIQSGAVGSCIVVCPKSLLANWQSELRRWAPGLCTILVTPRAEIKDEAWRLTSKRAHVLVTNYEQLRPPPVTLLSGRVDLLIADEAHRLRREDALVVKYVRRVGMERFWALTGTPIERDPADLSTLLSIADPVRVSHTSHTLPLRALRALARPYVLRRVKADVLPELPAMIDRQTILELTPAQRRSYDLAMTQASAQTRANALSLVNKLRLICDYDPETRESSKAQRICELVRTIRMSKEKVVIFSYLLEPLDIVREMMSLSRSKTRIAEFRGSMDVETRRAELTRFRSDPEVDVLLISTRAGGEGLTLTEANHVVFFNEWWNPSTNAQARDRVLRIGQGRVVQVHRFRCKNTIEELLDRIHTAKNKTFKELIEELTEASPTTPNHLLNALVQAVRQDTDGTEYSVLEV